MSCKKAPSTLTFESLCRDDGTVQTATTSVASFDASSVVSSSLSSSGDNPIVATTTKYEYAPTQSAVAGDALEQLQERLSERCNGGPDHERTQTTTLHLDSMMESFDLDVLTQFYDELMIPNFPLQEERDDLDDWLMYLDPSQRTRDSSSTVTTSAISDEGPSMDVLILRSVNNSTNTNTIIGGIAFEYYPQARAGLLSYMVVSSDFRRLGILATLHPVFCEALQGLHQVATRSETRISAILAETNTTIAGDVPPEVARKRHEILYKLGYRLLEFPYVQPPLAPDVDSFDDIMLLLYVGKPDDATTNNNKTATTTIPTQVLYDYVLDFYHSVFGYNSLDFQDHWYYRLVTWYAQQHPVTTIQMDLPWEDVTPQLKEAMDISSSMEQQQPQSQQVVA